MPYGDGTGPMGHGRGRCHRPHGYGMGRTVVEEPVDEVSYLEREASILSRQLNTIKKRLEELTE